jgi:peptidoglycan/LPS O-acetylase OafA/YrhL
MPGLRSSVESPAADHAPRLASITGLRFLAALGVFAYHVQPLLPSWDWMQPMLLAGQAGVSFFFVLSGFVLTWSDRFGDSARRFWHRRVARIVPTHAVTWLIGIPVAALWFGAWPRPWSLVATLSLTQAWSPDKSLFFGVNGVAWSLSCEALFYALFPVLIVFVRRSSREQRLWAMAACTTLLAALQLGTWAAEGAVISQAGPWPYWLISVLPIGRLPEFVFGMLAAAHLKASLIQGQVPDERNRWWSRTPPAAALAMVALYAAGCFPLAIVAGWLTVAPFGLLICAAARADVTGGGSVFSRRWAVRLGEWSFAFYMSHQLVLRLVGSYWPFPQLPLLQTAVDLGLAILSCALLYRFVEVPAERRIRPASVRPKLPPSGSRPVALQSQPTVTVR